MIAFIKGTVEETSDDCAILDCGGVGYRIFMPSGELSKVKKAEGVVKVHTYYHVREDQISLFGFCDREGVNMFRMLIGISGVGPKAALAILSCAPVPTLVISILTGDINTLCKAQGVGKKLAQRIVLELKDKFKNQDIQDLTASEVEDVPRGDAEEALGALMSLGYTRQEAGKALSKVDKKLTVEDMIKEALKLLMKG